MRQRPWIRALFLIVAAGIVWSLYVVLHICQISQTANPRKADVAIVLGAAVWVDRPSPGLRERLDLALWLYQQHYVPKLLVSGGLSEGKRIAEADAMKQYLLDNGVPREDILTEDQSHDTYQNLKNSKQVMEQHQLHSALIVSHGYHLARALDIAQTIQLQADPVRVDSHVLFIPYYYAREVLAYSYWQLEKFDITYSNLTSLTK